jgi:hypothetical protein
MAKLNKFNKQANAKLNEDTVNKLEEAFAIGADVSAACFYAEISRESYYNWISENKELKEKFDRLREKPVLKAYQTVAKDLEDISTAKWYLERRRKSEFAVRTELTGKEGDAIQHDILGEEAKKRLKKYKTDGDV